MTEQIQELAVKAKLMAEEDINRQISYNAELKAFANKFAELIVQDACERIEHEYKYALGEKTQWAMSQDVQDLLKEHYGIDYDPGEP